MWRHFPHGLVVRIPPFQGGSPGSSPGVETFWCGFVVVCVCFHQVCLLTKKDDLPHPPTTSNNRDVEY